jgi:hypothetical protein
MARFEPLHDFGFEGSEEKEDDDEEEDNDDVPSSTEIEVDVTDFEPGLQVLETAGRTAPAEVQSVTLIDYEGLPYFADETERTDSELRVLCRQFARFVALVDLYGRQGVRAVTFSSVQFGNPGWEFDEDDMQRLFGEVLPDLPFLERLRFHTCALLMSEVGLFASKLPSSTSLVELDIEGGTGSFLWCVPEIAAMIRRNVPLQVLKLNAREKMDRDACRQIFESLQCNTHLRSLEVAVEEVYDGALLLPSQEASSLRRLRIQAERWTWQGKVSLANQMKTNHTLEELRVVSVTPGEGLSGHPWVEALQAHNYTLLVLSENAEYGHRPNNRDGMGNERVVALLRRNRRIRQALDQLQGYHVSPTILLPALLEMVSGLPTLLYRFVRLGNVNSLCELLLVRQQKLGRNGQAKGRGRTSPSPRRPSARVARAPQGTAS